MSLKVLRIILQQVGTGFFVGKETPLVLDEIDARTFRNSTAAVDYCIARGIDDVDVLMRFSDSRYDVRLRPFTHPEWRCRTVLFADHAEQLGRLQQEIGKRRERARILLAQMESIHLEAKERRKQYPFKPARVGRNNSGKKTVVQG
jgi:hypothetical protein